MKQALEAMRELTGKAIAAANRDQALIEELRREDARFHIAIISAAKSELLKKEVLRLHIISRVIAGLTPGSGKAIPPKDVDDVHRREVQAGHDAIYQAIERGDATEAKLAMERHIQDIIDTNLRILARADQMSLARQLSEEELSYTP